MSLWGEAAEPQYLPQIARLEAENHRLRQWLKQMLGVHTDNCKVYHELANSALNGKVLGQ